MRIHIEALTFDVIIGLLDFEREREQPVIVDLEALYDYSSERFIDYADMVTLIKAELKKKKYMLLEEALLGLKHQITAVYPHIEELSLKISKPEIMAECRVALSHTWKF